jgi:hypothetical protein
MNYSQAAGGRMMEDIIDAMKRPDYGEIILSGAESTSALEKALMKLNADVRGTELISDARVKAAKMGAADAATLANAGTWAAGAKGIGQVARGFMGTIPTGGGGAAAPMKVAPGWSGGDTTGVSYDDVLSMSGDKDYTNTIMNGGAMEWSSEWP